MDGRQASEETNKVVAFSRHKVDGRQAASKMGGGTPGEVMNAAYFLSEIIRQI
jgi:hypothetical protein